MLSYIFIGIAIICIIVHAAIMKKPRTLKKMLEIAFIYIMVVNIGFGGLIAFFGHVFNGPQIAAMIGWPAGSPFQYEVGVADLAFGVIAVLTIWIRGNFWFAAALANAIFLIGCAVGHIRDLILSGNTAVYNAGPSIYLTDIVIPVIVLILAIAIPQIGGKRKK